MKKKSLIKLAKKYGTPLYVYDGDLIEKRYKEMFKFFPWSKLKIYYAMKANYNPFLLKILLKQGSSIDAVSLGDVLLAKKVGFPSSRILFTSNKITDQEMDAVKKEGVLFNIGSLSRLEKYGRKYPKSEVCIRFNPDVVAGEHKKVRTGGDATKFGILISDLDKLKKIVEKYSLKVIGVHEHTGSGIPETVQIMQGMKNIIKIATPENFPDLRFIDFGGGFKIPYKKNEKHLDYKNFGKKTTKLVSEVCKKYGRKLEIYFEPGKYLVGESGVLLTKITTLKQTLSKSIVGVDSGFPQLIRPMFYEAYHQIENLTSTSKKTKKYDVVGNICESGDCFGENRRLPFTNEGDILAIKTAGAYCYSMGGNYNLRPMPAEILVKKSKARLIRKRLSYKEMVNQILKETNYI